MEGRKLLRCLQALCGHSKVPSFIGREVELVEDVRFGLGCAVHA